MFFILEIFIDNIKMAYGDRVLLNIKTAYVYSGDKIGIVGENGAGKTTLLNIIAGEIKPESGKVMLNGPLSYIKQLQFDEITDSIIAFKWQAKQDPKSGGEITRAKIAEAMGKNNPIMLCDEPTSNLDEAGIIQLEKALHAYKGAMLLVSHDRKLMDSVCNTIWEIENDKVVVYRGNYSSYNQEKEKTRVNKQKEYDKYLAEKNALQSTIRERTKKAKGMKSAPKRMGRGEASLHKMDIRQKAGKMSGDAGVLKSRLSKLQAKDKPAEQVSYTLNAVANIQKLSKTAVQIEDLTFGYNDNVVLSGINLRIMRGEKVCIAGDNGCGKSTLLNCIVQGDIAVRIAPSNTIGYFRQNSLDLDEQKTALENVIEKSIETQNTARNMLAALGIKRQDVFKKVAVLSGGERCKVSLAALLCRQCSILVLDEPTNYLDIYVLEALENMLKQYSGTLIIVSHDRYFRQSVTDREIVISQGEVKKSQNNTAKKQSNISAEIMLIEMKMSALIVKKKGLAENMQLVLDAEYETLQMQLHKLKQA